MHSMRDFHQMSVKETYVCNRTQDRFRIHNYCLQTKAMETISALQGNDRLWLTPNRLRCIATPSIIDSWDITKSGSCIPPWQAGRQLLCCNGQKDMHELTAAIAARKECNSHQWQLLCAFCISHQGKCDVTVSAQKRWCMWNGFLLLTLEDGR